MDMELPAPGNEVDPAPGRKEENPPGQLRNATPRTPVRGLLRRTGTCGRERVRGDSGLAIASHNLRTDGPRAQCARTLSGLR